MHSVTEWTPLPVEGNSINWLQFVSLHNLQHALRDLSMVMIRDMALVRVSFR